MLRNLFGDLRFGARLLRKNGVLSAATILTFTIGIGLNAGVFTIIDGLLFRPRVAYDPPRFVELQSFHPSAMRRASAHDGAAVEAARTAIVRPERASGR